MTRKRVTVVCGNPLPNCKKNQPCPHLEEHLQRPNCLIPCDFDEVCIEVQNKADYALVAEQA